jgi:archaeal flagellar protein FlaJ
MPKIEPSEKRLVAIVSVALGVVMLVAAIVTLILFRAVTLPLTWDKLLVVGLMISLFPPAAVEYLDMRWQRGIDKNIPRLLREIAESGRTGLTLTRAIEVSADRDYGPLTPELKRLLAQLSWGASLEDAMLGFATRARTKLAQRTATLITEVARSGGDTQEVMEQVNRHINELQDIDRERYVQMRPYAVVVYIAFGVFLFTDIMLIQTFFTQIVNLQSSVMQASGGGGVFGGIGSVNISLLKTTLFHATIIQALFGGLIAGKMSEGKLGAGLKHSVLLLLITFMAFFIFVWGL